MDTQNDRSPIKDAGDALWKQREIANQRLGYGVVIAIIFFGGIWAASAPIQSAALAIGVVQVEGKKKPIQHFEGGIVSEILVKAGDVVERDQPLLTLDATAHRAQREILLGRIYNLSAKFDRLQAERDDAESLAFSGLLELAGDSDTRAEIAMINESRLFEARKLDREGEEEVIRSNIQGMASVAQSRSAIIESLDSELADLETLLSEGYVDKQRLRELERTRSRTLGELTDIEVAIKKAQLEILQMRKKFKTNVVDELTELQDFKYKTEKEYAAADDRVVRATVRAPISGTVMNVGPNTIGAVVSSGDTLLEIVPHSKRMIVEARVSPMDIDRVRLGQTAEVRFSVFKDAYTVSGTLTKLSADRVVSSVNEPPYYAAEVTLLLEDLELLGGAELVPGMPAEVLIKTGTRTMLGYLTSPINRAFSRALLED